jgi:small GTP-binding protein
MSNSVETVKVVLLGESGVGKTSITTQFTEKSFSEEFVTSASATFVSKTLEFEEYKKALKFEIWDTAGQERFRSLAKIFYKDAKVVILVYDITDEKSYNEMTSYWYEQVKNNTNEGIILAIVANKSDLYQNQQVPDAKGQEFASEIKAIFQLTSAKSDTGITNLFENIGKKFFDPNYNLEEVEKKAKEDYMKKKQEENMKKKDPNTTSRFSIDRKTLTNKKEKKKWC